MSDGVTTRRDGLDDLLRGARPSLEDQQRRWSIGPARALTSDSWKLFASVDEMERRPTGNAIASFRLDDGGVVEAVVDEESRRVDLPFDPGAVYRTYVTEAWRTIEPARGLTASQLNAFYTVKRLLPRQLQLTLRRLLASRAGLPSFPAWPLDRSVLRLMRFSAACALYGYGTASSEVAFDWFWPHSYRAAVILTHDVESAAGLRLAVEIADLEEEHGLRSSFNLGAWYDIDDGVVRELTSRGFEIGVHGLRHDRSLFASRGAFDYWKPELARLAERLGAVGFRSPATHRVIEWLAELPMLYDCSVPHSDPFEPQPGGCCTIWPFLLGDVVELPYTMPQDHTLFTILRHKSPSLWLSQLDQLERSCGLVQCLTHPDPDYLGDPRNRDHYSELLLAIKDRPALWTTLPRKVATWWRSRHNGEVACERGLLRIGDELDDIEFAPMEPAATITA
jgi:peptidoglycan/xylan/chitin deacetylase (PgdA/CDA1 family)